MIDIDMSTDDHIDVTRTQIQIGKLLN